MGSSLSDSAKPIAILASILLGAAAAFFSLPAIFSHAPNTLTRGKNIYHALHGGEEKLPEVVVLGNSITLNGIDAKQLYEAMPDCQLAWNLATGGQSLAETLLVCDELPETTQLVVLNLFTYALTHERDPPLKDRFVAYRIYGYEPSESLIEAIRDVLPASSSQTLIDPAWRVTLDSRWICKQGIDNFCRSKLRKDLVLDKSARDLFHPSPFTKQASQESILTQIERKYVRRTAEDGHLRPKNSALLKAIMQNLAEKKVQLVFTLVPEHPGLRDLTTPQYYQNLKAELAELCAPSGVPLFTFIDLLEAELFIDQIHPNAEGTHIWTGALAEKLTQSRGSSR